MSWPETHEDFVWDSDDQFKAYLAFLKWARDKGVSPEVRPIDFYNFQKNHEAFEYFRNFFSEQISSLENQIKKLQDELKCITSSSQRLP